MSASEQLQELVDKGEINEQQALHFVRCIRDGHLNQMQKMCRMIQVLAIYNDQVRDEYRANFQIGDCLSLI